MTNQYCKLSRQILLLAMLILLCWHSVAKAEDPWAALRSQLKNNTTAAAIVNSASTVTVSPAMKKDDPWQQLQAVFLPFTPQEEQLARTNSKIRQRIAAKLHYVLTPYNTFITAAAEHFQIPAAVIGAVIMVESGGNPRAAAKTSSAKGLMQTISTTFTAARQALAAQGICIVNNPFNPRASIMAGTWYLDKMYRQVNRDRRTNHTRSDISSWKLPSEYYYAGPGNGRKRNPIVIIYSGGKQIRIDKAGYSRKVMQWAKMIGGLE